MEAAPALDAEAEDREALPGTSCFSKMFFQFMTPVVRMARSSEQLEEGGVPQHTLNLDTRHLFDTFQRARQQQQQKKIAPSVWRAMMAGRWRMLLITAVGYIMTQALSLAGPLLLKQIVQGLTCRDEPSEPSCGGTERRLYMCGPKLLGSSVASVT